MEFAIKHFDLLNSRTINKLTNHKPSDRIRELLAYRIDTKAV